MAIGLRLHDTLSGTVRDFVPMDGDVKLYVCGVTPYDTAHLGHAFTYVAFDVLVRHLRSQGYGVRYVQNITDVDDPLFAKARQLGEPYQELAVRETERYLEDMDALNILPADRYPRASSETSEMIRMAEALIDLGHAYLVDGHVYFRISSDPRYGELSKLDRREMFEISRERGGDPDDPRKEDPLDFLLWRPSGGDEFHVASVWGEGLPGWHLECSAMSLKYLGIPIDIHGGGADLIYPHHESEIAQSETSTEVRPFARHWMHTAMVYMHGQKMSKSLGNMVFARDLINSHGADAVRVYVSSCHYRSELHWNEDAFVAAAGRAARLREALGVEGGGDSSFDLAGFRERFVDCLNHDLDTPGALDVLADLAASAEAAAAGGEDVHPAQQLLRELGGVLGLTFEHPFRSPSVASVSS
jgi:L-cysteine:1D-myo-inositol 2-amino-2-deoxy-alpha-D-glucopyranoside ligase